MRPTMDPARRVYYAVGGGAYHLRPDCEQLHDVEQERLQVDTADGSERSGRTLCSTCGWDDVPTLDDEREVSS
ncbi:hypothetical protein [Halomarina pelagica]|uniref:hypothetical protein n=1 Tax=Halomarina pelagica TaxID=2961599 RepID=UPI0020C51BD0|nr:hypothetical protein [Halomarina sp. BND7]